MNHLSSRGRIGVVAVVVLCALIVGSSSRAEAAPGTQSTGTASVIDRQQSRPSVPDLGRATGPETKSTTVKPGAPPNNSSSARELVCADARSATFGAVFEAVFDSFAPSLPVQHRGAVRAAKRVVLANLHRMKISSLVVSTHPGGQGASPDSPMNTYRDPLSQWIVTQLMNVKDGRAAQPIRADNLTVSQAIETAWLYFYATAVIPLSFVADTMPGLYTLGPLSVGTLITLPISVGVSGMKVFYSALGEAMFGKCLVRMAPSEIRDAGRPDSDLRFTTKVPRLIQETADQVSIAEPGTCPAVGDLPIERIVTRTSDCLQSVVPDRAVARVVETRTRHLKAFMRTTRVPHNLIPGDPADFSAIEKLISMGLGFAPTVGGTATDILIGLGHNIGEGDNLVETVPLSKLTVTKSMTAAYYAYAFTTQVLSGIYGLGATALAASLGGVDVLPRIDGVINAPNTYGLVVYHNVLRSVCLTEDRTASPRSAKPVADW